MNMFKKNLLLHDQNHVGWRIKNIDKVNDARIGCAQWHKSNLVKYFSGAVLPITYLSCIFCRILYSSGTMPTFPDCSK
jgi:hypothetical protein